MGSLLEGAAVGIGVNTERRANQRNITEREDLQRQHDIRLEGLRNKNAMDAATQQNLWETEAAEQQNTWTEDAASELARNTTARDTARYTHERELEGNKNALEVWKTNADNESDEWVAAYRAWSTARTGAKGTNRKANSWDVSFQEVPDPDNPGMYTQAMVASHPNGTSVQQVGNRMIEHTEDGPARDHALKPWNNPKKGHDAEMDLLKSVADGNDQSEVFLHDFGYLPTSYYRAAFAVSDDADLQEFNESFNRDRGSPAFPYPGNMPRSTRDRNADEAGTDGGNKEAPMSAEEQTEVLAGKGNLDPTTGPPVDSGPAADPGQPGPAYQANVNTEGLATNLRAPTGSPGAPIGVPPPGPPGGVVGALTNAAVTAGDAAKKAGEGVIDTSRNVADSTKNLLFGRDR